MLRAIRTQWSESRARTLAGIVCLVLGLVELRAATVPEDAFAVLGPLVLAAILLGPFFAGILANPGAILHPPGSDPPQPAYSIAQARRAQGRDREAMEAYEEIVAKFPREVEAWLAMACIALERLHDEERAAEIVRRALVALPDDLDHLFLLKMYRASRRKAGYEAHPGVGPFDRSLPS